METVTDSPGRPSFDGARAQRIIDATRTCVADRGVAGATFEHVARRAQVSRGLLHYYFGTKERLLAEVVRRDCDVRMTLLDEQLAGARDADAFVALLRAQLEDVVRDEPGLVVLIFELFTLSRRNADVAAELAQLLRRIREHVAGLLAAKRDEGVLELRDDPAAIADVIFSLADGLALRMIADGGHDWTATIEAAAGAVRALLAPPAAG